MKNIVPFKEKLTTSIKNSIPEANVWIHDVLPKAVQYLVPLAINKVVPRRYAGLATDVIIPYILDTILPSAVDQCLDEETRIAMAIQNSMEEISLEDD
ncbi:uncharacterized protein LOC111695537 isoform X2 [Eurytemora carolleeae]|nr:uncharacterized protein LOC111695537 isoform X2 [Eurytemora carolleeae]|eukprot:XP_023320671.1 uncharacterized protein LOC111695537 isoform X2 [Eurytemora affinis]